MAAQVGLAGGAANGSDGNGCITFRGFGVLLVEEDGLDVFADGGELGVSESGEIADELFGSCSLFFVGGTLHLIHQLLTHSWVSLDEGCTRKERIAEVGEGLHLDGKKSERVAR